MNGDTLALYVAQAWIIFTYLAMALRPRKWTIQFHWANFACGAVMLAILLSGGWKPIYLITCFFTTVGLVGVVMEFNRTWKGPWY